MEVPSGMKMMMNAMGLDFDPAQLMQLFQVANTRLTALEKQQQRIEDKLDIIVHHMSLEATAEDRFAKVFGGEVARLPSEVQSNGGRNGAATGSERSS